MTPTPQPPVWVDTYIKPLLTLCALVAALLTGLEFWIASKFVTKDELQALQAQLRSSHADHMDDYRTIEAGIERLNQVLRKRLPRQGHEDDDE